jgi:ribosomal-protein-alanine N-acetyltransferase
VPPRIREAQPGDFDLLWRIDQECFAPGISYSREELSHYMARRGAFTLVAEQPAAGRSGPSSTRRGRKPAGPASRIVGFTVIQRHPRGLGHVITIDVLPQARRSGIGSLLMEAAEERLRAQGCASVFLETAVDNLPALKFYKRRGYFVLKTIPRYYQDKIDALLLGKHLR